MTRAMLKEEADKDKKSLHLNIKEAMVHSNVGD